MLARRTGGSILDTTQYVTNTTERLGAATDWWQTNVVVLYSEVKWQEVNYLPNGSFNKLNQTKEKEFCSHRFQGKYKI